MRYAICDMRYAILDWRFAAAVTVASLRCRCYFDNVVTLPHCYLVYVIPEGVAKRTKRRAVAKSHIENRISHIAYQLGIRIS